MTVRRRSVTKVSRKHASSPTPPSRDIAEGARQFAPNKGAAQAILAGGATPKTIVVPTMGRQLNPDSPITAHLIQEGAKPMKIQDIILGHLSPSSMGGIALGTLTGAALAGPVGAIIGAAVGGAAGDALERRFPSPSSKRKASRV